MGPRMWPALLNICGYLLPIVFLYRANLVPIRFANYLFIMPIWFATMFYTGVMVETRIYGELCGYTAVAVVLIAERYITTLNPQFARQEIEPQLATPEPYSELAESGFQTPEHTTV